MGVNSLPKTVTRQRRDCDLNPCSSEPESSTLTTRLPSHPITKYKLEMQVLEREVCLDNPGGLYSCSQHVLFCRDIVRL